MPHTEKLDTFAAVLSGLMFCLRLAWILCSTPDFDFRFNRG